MPPEEQHDVAAAEVALGLLEGEERAAALRRMLAEPAFAADVAWWRDALAPLVAEWAEATPSADVEARIMAAVEGDEVSQAVRWRAVAVALAACLVAAVALLAMLREPVVRIVRLPAPAALVAAIQPSDGKGAALAATYDPGSGEMRLSGAPTVPQARVAELWVIGKDGPPRSLGLLRGDGVRRVAVAQARRGLLTEGVTLAVSVEPLGGSPTGLPTGPVVATGTLARV
jgi:anti-sigma-K factor RskA